YYGPKGVRFLSYMAAALISYSFIMFWFGMKLVPADFWPSAHLDFLADGEQKSKLSSEVSNFNTAYKLVFGQGLWIIIGSLTAFLVGQIIDVFVFQKIKARTGESKIWLRATGSTLISQAIDSYIVLFIAFYIGAGWPLSKVFAIGTVNYIYKFLVAILLTPLIYMVHYFVDRYLGHDEATKLKNQAMLDN
ncbi:MAG: queuosine precursor transporter, partial [Bacteroidota bacterium]|nr:queuosine precursor transporter [Bacteroidota bacterium]